jgi:hypothetical protein
MKYLKTFEKFTPRTILYECNDFTIEYNSNDAFCATTKNGQLGAIPYMTDLIRKNSKYLKNPKLRDVIVRSRDIASELDYLDLYPEKIKNIENFRSGPMRHFWGGEYNKNLPIDTFMELTLKYTPIIADAIKDVKTLGDVIDNYQVVYDQLHSELEPLEIYIDAKKYNL